jgi:hypothetical protein
MTDTTVFRCRAEVAQSLLPVEPERKMVRLKPRQFPQVKKFLKLQPPSFPELKEKLSTNPGGAEMCESAYWN